MSVTITYARVGNAKPIYRISIGPLFVFLEPTADAAASLVRKMRTDLPRPTILAACKLARETGGATI
jgi:hypothetical protein